MPTLRGGSQPNVAASSAVVDTMGGPSVGPTDFSTEAVRVTDGVLIEELPDCDSVFLNMENERYFGLDEMGTRLWAALTTSPTIDDAIQFLLAEYDVDEVQLRSDLEQFLADLVDRGLVEFVGR